MAKLTQLSPAQLANAKEVDKALVAIGLTNVYLRAGILAVVSKESGFEPKGEISYSNTPVARIREVFGLSKYTDKQILDLRKSDEAFFNVVYYRADLGNTQSGDGWKYRGRGFNQITGRANYTAVGKAIGVDLINNPDLLNTIPIAAKALASFFRQSIISGQMSGKFILRYGIVTTSQISDIVKGATIAHQANMGWGKVPSQDPTGGFQITLSDAPTYLPLTQQ